MNCDNCHEHDATVHFQQIVNGQSTEINLCDKCAQAKGMISFAMDKPSFFGNLLSGFMEEQKTVDGIEKGTKVTCQCGWSSDDLRKSGFLGCPLCYYTFKESLTPILRRIHGSNRHIGKVPAKIPVKQKVNKKITKVFDPSEINDLKSKLTLAINEERYEDAAKLRDRIKRLEKKLNKDMIKDV